MSRFQWRAIAICIALYMIDGFDVLVVAFAAPVLSADWQLSGKQLGLLLSAGLFGMSFGSMFVAPWADRFGRRAVIIACIALVAVGMLLSAVANGVPVLLVLRIVTGIGIGGMLASVNVIAAEYASDRWRGMAISLVGTGYPIGATAGGLIAAVLMTHQGWRSVFVFGAALSGVMLIPVWRGLPESVDFLLSRRPAGALGKLNRLLQKMHYPPEPALPALAARGDTAEPGDGWRALFQRGLALSTVMSFCSFFMVMMCFYFVLSWTPKLLVEAGLSARQGISGGLLLNVGGIAGGLLFGVLATRFELRRLTMVFLLLTTVSLYWFGRFSADLAMGLPVALLSGFAIFGCMIGLYALVPPLYPAAIRATGMGCAIGVGRIGAILSPVIAGWLFDSGWRGQQLYYLFAVALIVALCTVKLLPRLPQRPPSAP